MAHNIYQYQQTVLSIPVSVFEKVRTIYFSLKNITFLKFADENPYTYNLMHTNIAEGPLAAR